MLRHRPFSLLTPELIERVLLPLSLRDRPRCMMVCKKFLEVGSDGSSKLWESVACDPHSNTQMRTMLQWIWRKSKLVKRLSLHTHNHLSIAQLMSLWGLMTSAFVSLREGLVSTLPSPVPLFSSPPATHSPVRHWRPRTTGTPGAMPHVCVSVCAQTTLCTCPCCAAACARPAAPEAVKLLEHSPPCSLDFSLPEPVELSGWVIVLTRLRWLSVCAHSIHVTDDVGQRLGLRYLHLATPDTAATLGGDTVTFSEHCIPGTLQELSLLDVHVGSLPAALTSAARSLSRLHLHRSHSPVFGALGLAAAGQPPSPAGAVLGLEPLPALTALRCLELDHCASLAAIPQELSMLSTLSQLDLSFSLPVEHLERLSMLRGLSMLSMQGCQLRALDGGLQELLRLHTLCLSSNPDLQLSLLHGWVGQVQQLDIDLVAAARNHDTLSTMTQLEVLCLCWVPDPEQRDLPPAAAMAVLRALRCLHDLHLLYFKDGAHRQLVATVELLAEFVELLRRRRSIDVQSTSPYMRNPFQERRMTWDEVKVDGES